MLTMIFIINEVFAACYQFSVSVLELKFWPQRFSRRNCKPLATFDIHHFRFALTAARCKPCVIHR